MKLKIGFFLIMLAPSIAAAAKCKISDLQKCLDSACAENIDMEPGARCYLCGSSMAKRPEKTEYNLGGDTPGMQSLDLGKSSKNTISDKDLKKAPAEPGARYAWATRECVKKLKDCAPEDATDSYDKLIDQSCKIALGETEYEASRKKAAVKKTEAQCNAELTGCLLAESKCDSNMMKCEEDGDFNDNFSACMVDAAGCGDFASALRDKVRKWRDEMVEKKDARIDELAARRRAERAARMDAAKQACEFGKQQCAMEMCGNMPNGLSGGACPDKLEFQWASSLCQFMDVACGKIK
jgi:hypothetical protein